MTITREYDGDVFLIECKRLKTDDVHDAQNVRFYGAVGNGIVDDTAAIQAAIDANENGSVYIPTGTYRIDQGLTISTPLEFHGTGTLVGTTALVPSHMVRVLSTTDVHIHGLTFSLSLLSEVSKQCILITGEGGRNITIEKCIFLVPVHPIDADYQFIRMNRAYYVKVSGCHMEVTDPSYDVTVVEDSGSQRYGVYVNYGCRHVVITGNTCFKMGVAIGVQYVSTGETPLELISEVTITSNTIRSSAYYGIMLYSRETPPITPISNCVIANNNVDTVYGNFYNTEAPGYSHGAGIYLQTTENVSVVGNVVRNVCINTNSQTLVPAAIGGLLRNTYTTITGNVCDTGTYFGIVAAGDYTVVSGNTLSKFKLSCIYVNVGNFITIQGNMISNTGVALADNGNGIRTFNSTATPITHLSITGNVVVNCIFGLRIELAQYASIVGNNVLQTDAELNSGHGISIGATTSFATVSENTIKRNVGGRGMRIDGTSINVHNNYIDGGASNENYYMGGTASQVISSGNITPSNNMNNTTGIAQMAAAQSLSVTWYTPGMLIELTSAVALISTINIASFNNRNGIVFYMMSSVAGNTIEHLGANANPAVRFRLTAGVDLEMVQNVIYQFRWSATLASWVQV